MRLPWMMSIAVLTMSAAAPAHADVLTMDCKSSRNQTYQMTYDSERKELKKTTAEGSQIYQVVRSQFELNGDALAWGQSRETHGDILAFFGTKQMVKNFFGNGSEVTDTCIQK